MLCRTLFNVPRPEREMQIKDHDSYFILTMDSKSCLKDMCSLIFRQFVHWYSVISEETNIFSNFHNMYILCNVSQLHKALEISMLNQGRTTYFFVLSGQNLIEITKCMLCSAVVSGGRKTERKCLYHQCLSRRACGLYTSIGWA